MADIVIIEAALNGGLSRAEHPGVPLSAGELAAEARCCAEAGASVVHVHARGRKGEWTASQAEYTRVIRAIRETAPGVLISITSLRPEGVPSERVQHLLTRLPRDARPDLISVNLGHIATWEVQEESATRGPQSGLYGRDTVHYPNSYDDIVELLAACRREHVIPELGVMDFGFISNAMTLLFDGILPFPTWFLLELDSPYHGSGRQVAPAEVSIYDALAAALREEFPDAPWAAHGAGLETYAVVQRALEDGAHVRVGFEDCPVMPDGELARSNADQVAWAVEQAEALGRAPATPAEAKQIINPRL